MFSDSDASTSDRPPNSITSRLSELRNRSVDEDRAFMSQRCAQREAESEDDEHVVVGPAGPHSGRGDVEAGPRARLQFGPFPSDPGEAYLDEAGHDGFGQQMALAGAAEGAVVTPRSMRYLVTDPKPEIKLIHRFKPGQDPAEADFWRSFLGKCRLAWGVFFPPKPQTAWRRRSSGVAAWVGSVGRMLLTGDAPGVGEGGGGGGALSRTAGGMSAKQVVVNRLQMVLIADRCGVSAESLLDMKAQTLAALADLMGGDLASDVSQLEVQVSALKPSGERVTMTIGFADMLGDEQLRDPMQYDYEYEDDDDYFTPEEDDDSRIGDIAEAPASGLKAARVAAVAVDAE